jgi:hypothetical protein
MTQYRQSVEEQRTRIAAEKWAKGVNHVHVHGISSMWYDDRPEDTSDGKTVTDVQYNDGHIQRTLNESGEVVIMGTKLTGQALIDEYQKSGR